VHFVKSERKPKAIFHNPSLSGDATTRHRELSEIGLRDCEARVYLALLEHRGATPANLPMLASVPRSRVYETLKKLWQIGFVEQQVTGRRKIYMAVDPETAIQRVLDQRREHEETRLEQGRQLAAKLTPVFLAGQAVTNDLAYMSFIKNPDLIRRRFVELQKKVHREILLFSKGPYMLSPLENTPELEALKRGVTVRVIYELGEAVSKELQTTIKHYTAAGEQARVHPELPVKLAIFDRRTVLLCMNDPATTQRSMVTLVIEHPDMALMLRKSFEQYWSEGIEWRQFQKHDGVAVFGDSLHRELQV
jgi:HTH-type transcriptional regulator, sugar sensing transcriptional regulator